LRIPARRNHQTAEFLRNTSEILMKNPAFPDGERFDIDAKMRAEDGSGANRPFRLHRIAPMVSFPASIER
jgi:hypothetical protein